MDRTVCAYSCDENVLQPHATVLPDKRFQMRHGAEAQDILTSRKASNCRRLSIR